MMGRVLVVDPCPIVHIGLDSAFRNSEFSICLATGFVREAVDWVSSRSGALKVSDKGESERPAEIILCDFELADGTSMDLQSISRRFDIPLVLFSAWQNPVHFGRMVEAGCRGLINKTANTEELLSSLRKVLAGKRALKRIDTRRVTGALATPRLESHIDFPLTQREFAVLKELATGQTNKSVAEKLGISYETVKEHVQHILAKLGVSDRTQAAILAVRKGLL